MSARTWARHYHDDWMSRAGDPRLPYWLRVAAAGFGSHGENGHARFKRGQLALILATVDQETGEIQPYSNVGRAISDAVEYGWLAEGSFWGCLVVPAHSIKRGELDKRPSPCPMRPRHARVRGSNPSLSERFEGAKPTPSERFDVRIPHSVSDSMLNPLSSYLSLVPQPHEDSA